MNVFAVLTLLLLVSLAFVSASISGADEFRRDVNPKLLRARRGLKTAAMGCAAGVGGGMVMGKSKLGGCIVGGIGASLAKKFVDHRNKKKAMKNQRMNGHY